jgi:hypothetical protein
MVREPDATRQPTPHDIQLMSKHRVLSFKPQLRLKWRGQDGQNETAARSFRQLRRFHHVINSNKVFGTHNAEAFGATGLMIDKPDDIAPVMTKALDRTAGLVRR